MLALARRIVSGEEHTDSGESVFAQAQQVAADAEVLLVDAVWRAPEPVVVEVHANGNGRTALPVGGSADDDETPEQQRTLFSWAEFMAEGPDESQRRGQDEATTLSLFEWALEREREAALAGAD